MHLIYAKQNDDQGKKDASAVFVPEAEALAQTLGVEPFFVDTTQSGHSEVLIEDLENYSGDVDTVNVFCHGWRKGVQLLPRGKQGAKRVANALAERNVKMLNLFCCSAAKPHLLGNFCEWVSKQCKTIGHRIQVFGHETAGHATWNPRVHIYWPEEDASILAEATDPKGYKDEMRASRDYRLNLPFALFESGLGDEK